MTRPTVGIITLHRVHNFGSVLQTFATVRLLEQAGFAPTVIDYWRESEIDSVAGQLRHNYARWNRRFVTRTAFRALRGRALRRQAQNFRSFILEHVPVTERSYNEVSDLEQAPPPFDFFCVGSDQVWNTDYHVGDPSVFFLRFAPDGAPRFSLSSSFGRQQASEVEQEMITKELTRFGALSVRESSGVEILNGQGLDATQLVDPTLAISAEDWTALATEATPSNYVLIYQLHRSHSLEAAVQRICKAYDLKPVFVRGYWSPSAPSSRVHGLADTSVSTFLGLIKNAAYIVTDSFHGTAFALNFGIPFTPVFPPRYGERIRSLLALTSTESRGLVEGSVESEIGPLDTDHVRGVLENERARVRAYLDGIASN